MTRQEPAHRTPYTRNCPMSSGRLQSSARFLSLRARRAAARGRERSSEGHTELTVRRWQSWRFRPSRTGSACLYGVDLIRCRVHSIQQSQPLEGSVRHEGRPVILLGGQLHIRGQAAENVVDEPHAFVCEACRER